MAKLKFILTLPLLKTIADGLFTSALVYCLPLIGGSPQCVINDVQVLQNKVAQIVTKSPPRSSRDPMFDKLGWLTVKQLIAYHTLLQVYRIRQSQEPEYLFGILGTDNRNGRIYTPDGKLTIVQKSFVNRGTKLWNSLPADIRRSENVNQFKKLVKEWIKKNVQRF